MQALILAGGKGTRLRPLTVYTPKPIVPVLNRPFILYQIDILSKAGIVDIVLSLSYQPDKIEDLLGDGSDHGVRLRYVTEPNPLGTGGAYRFAADEIRGTTVVLNGDILTDIDISALIDFHNEKRSAATLALARVDDPSAYGLVEIDGGSKVVRFLEKPKPEDVQGLGINTINAGIYVLEPTVLDVIPPKENRSFEYDVFPELLKRGDPFFGYVIENTYWRDLGTPASYLAAHHDLIADKMKHLENGTGSASEIATAAMIDRSSVIGAGCVIKPGARITRSALGPGVHVEEKAVIEDSVIWGHTRVSTGAEVRGAVVGRSCHVGRNASVSDGSVLGDKTSLSDYTKV